MQTGTTRGDANAHHHRSSSHLWLPYHPASLCAVGSAPEACRVAWWKRDHDVGSVCGPGGKMPPDTAGKDACRYKLIHEPQVEKSLR